MSSEVKRYEVYGHDWDSEENPFGFWVMYSDYATLKAECEKLQAENEQLRDSTKRIDAYWQSELRDVSNERDALHAELEALKNKLRGPKNMSTARSPMLRAFEAQHGPFDKWLRENAHKYSLVQVSEIVGYSSPTTFQTWCAKYLPDDIKFKGTRGPYLNRAK